MTLLALDPGIATCGAAIFDDESDLVDADVFTSSPRSKPRGFRGAWAAADLGRRAGELATWMRDVLDRCEEIGGGLSHVVLEANAGGRGAHAVYQMALAAGVIRCAISEAVGPDRITYVTAQAWRDGLGYKGSPRPRPPKTKGKLVDKKAALKAHRLDTAAIKHADDVRLYALIESLPGGDRVRELVAGHGGRNSQCVHAWDSFGIGRWLLSASGAERFSVAA